MSKISRHEPEVDRRLREISSSQNIHWGTRLPYRMGEVGFASIGFADIPVVGCRVYCPNAHGMIPVIRQHIMRKVSELGLDDSALELTVHLGIESRKRMFEDENAASSSHGKKKFGQVARCWLEITRKEVVADYRDKLTKIYL